MLSQEQLKLINFCQEPLQQYLLALSEFYDFLPMELTEGCRWMWRDFSDQIVTSYFFVDYVLKWPNSRREPEHLHCALNYLNDAALKGQLATELKNRGLDVRVIQDRLWNLREVFKSLFLGAGLKVRR